MKKVFTTFQYYFSGKSVSNESSPYDLNVTRNIKQIIFSFLPKARSIVSLLALFCFFTLTYVRGESVPPTNSGTRFSHGLIRGSGLGVLASSNTFDACDSFKLKFNPLSDTLKICGNSVELDAGAPYTIYKWSNGAITQKISVRQSGWQKVFVTNSEGCTAVDSCFVSIVSTQVNGSGRWYCYSSQPQAYSFWIDSTFAGNNGLKASILWSTGARTFYISEPITKNSFNATAVLTNGVHSCNVTAFAGYQGLYTADTVIVSSDSAIIRKPKVIPPSINWSWKSPPGLTGDSVIVRKSGVYRCGYNPTGGFCPVLLEFFVIILNIDIDVKDTAIKRGSSITLNALYDTSGALLKNHRYLWSTGETTSRITVKPDKTTKYYVTLSLNNVSRKDSVTVTVVQPYVFNPLPDTLKVCGDSAVLDAGPSFTSYQWQNGPATQKFTVFQSGRYKVTVTDSAKGTATDSCFVSIVPSKIKGAVGYCAAKDVKYFFWVDSTFGRYYGLRPTVLWNSGDTAFSIRGVFTTDRVTVNATISDGVNSCNASATSMTAGKYTADTIFVNADSVILRAYAIAGLFSRTYWSIPGMPSLKQDSLIVKKSGNYSSAWSSTGPCGVINDYYIVMVNVDIDKKDTTVCAGSPVTLNAKYDTTGAIIKSRKFLWSTGDTAASITVRPLTTTKYYVTVTVENVSRKDSVTIAVFQTPVFNPLADTTRPASSVTLDAGTGFTRYNWSTGATTQSILAAANGKYKVSVTTAQGCVLADSTIVQLPETINLFIPVVQGQCGATIDVPVKAYAVKNLLTMQGSIVWNAADLQYQGIAGLGPVSLGMTASNFGISQSESGILTFSWNDATLKGVTLPDTAVLFVLRFTALGSLNRSIPLSITGSPTPLEFYDSYYRKKAISVRNGSVNLVCLATLTGRIISPLDGGIAGVAMSLTGTENRKAITDKNGIYQFQVISGNYIITPDKNNEKTKANGISTLDLALIQSHVLNTLPLNSPYKMIAADADNSGSVSTVDIVYIRRLLLGIDTALPGNRTWAFVDSAQTFANPMSPFPFNRNRTFTGLAGVVNQTFRAIKLGDVNWDRNPLIDQPMMEDTMKLYYEAGDVSNGEVKIRVRAKDVRAVMGFQYTMQWKLDQMEFLGIGENPLGVSFGERWTDEGYLALSWNDPQAMGISLKEGELMFELRFALRGSSAQTSIQAGSWKVATEVFNKDYQTIHLKMEALKTTVSQPLADDQLRVYPNPVDNVVNVQWNATTAGKGYVRILDATGRKMLEQKVDVLQGLNSYRLTLDKKIIGQGNYLIQIESEGRSRTSRIIVAK